MKNSKNVLIENQDRPVEFVERPPFPRTIMVELTNMCNHNCIMCGYSTMRRKKRVCNKELMSKIICDSYKYGGREIGFYLIGEPLLCQDLVFYVDLAKKTGFEYVFLTTNGALANLEKMKELIAAGLDSIKFSINGATKETYEIVHGSDDFMVVYENVKKLRLYLDENNVELKTFISFVKNKINMSDTDKLYELFEDLVDNIYIYNCGNQGGG